jgi:3-oxoacyl-[acyl-carrier protein] reductase
LEKIEANIWTGRNSALRLEETPRLLSGKKVLITGASRGMGRSIALIFAENGADLCLVSRKSADVESLASEIKSKWHSKVFPLQGDVSDPVDGNNIGGKAIELMGGVDVLVAPASYPFEPQLWNKSFVDLVEDDFLKVLSTDLLGSFRVAKGVIPQMVKQRSGVIILFSSTPAISGFNRGGAYTVSKAAVRSLAKEIACEYGEFNLRAYAVAPGNIKTESTFNNLSKDDQIALEQESPMKRWGEPDEIARVCLVLASDNMSFVTGQTLVVDGGTIML